MKRNKIITIAIIVTIIAIIGIYPMINKKGLNTSNNMNNSNPLKIYILAYNGEINDHILQSTISEFKSKYPQIKIEKVMFDINKDGGFDGYCKKILNDTLSGEGPDILYLDIINAKKLQKSLMLEDLKPFIENDKDFKKEDYNATVINAGMYKGKLTLMPLNYYVMQYATTVQLLKNNNINLKENCSQNDFIKAIEPYIASINGDKNKILFPAPIRITDFLASSGIDFIDYENKKVHFDKPEFKEIIENYKKIYKTSKKEEDMQGYEGNEGINGLKNGNTLFSGDKMFIAGQLLSLESVINGSTKEEPVINNFPAYKEKDTVNAIVGHSMAISKKTKNKNAAYNFIKIALSEKIQSPEENLRIQCMPVNKKAAENIKKQYISKEVGKSQDDYTSTKIINQKLSQNFERYYNKITNKVEKAVITDYTIENLMKECLKPYFQDKESYESAVKVLENKVKLYINE
ncbi:carbohydrate ABC transporter substrate-binding protein [Clostridium sp. P21]|uniref:Carbohydrate ABC transporter substrate-binding protein n=1 Tax=Clostridium muellerianum TaxID=2716538 RepID=A0A7Y0EHV8_9CLOT|nr:ABC transporter substrate-binding protein [Clostridium muellerianum]NMM63402.1 carbohydrate ABC transporter substrate-binding protein [Clostridium muellerianum]